MSMIEPVIGVSMTAMARVIGLAMVRVLLTTQAIRNICYLVFRSVRNNTVAGLPTSPIFSALSTGNEL